MLRQDAIAAIYPELSECVVVTIMGATAAELFACGHRPNFFYLEHAMGLASSMGLGIALSRPDLQVVVLDGDGATLMNLGGLTTIARYAPPNLTHIIFDNEVLLSVGVSFTTATAGRTDLEAVAAAAGIPRTNTASTPDAFRTAFLDALAAPETASLVAKVEPVGPPSFFIDCHMLENRFEFARFLQGT